MNIKAGDNVMVVKARPCGCPGTIGAVFRAGRILFVEAYGATCVYCGALMPFALATTHPDGSYVAVNRLIKLDDPKEPEHVERTAEVSA